MTIPEQSDLDRLRAEADGCRACPLWRHATQTVFGEGNARARVMLVGEQPGNEEDQQGHPFVGPAGALLTKALEDAGIARDSVYVTNAVKHFKWEPRGKRRIHKKPRWSEIRACQPWLEAELEAIKPDGLVLLGATAAQALLGPSFRVSTERGREIASPLAPVVVATVHPSSILRAPDDAAREEAYRSLVQDLEVAAAAIEQHRGRDVGPGSGAP